jgi:hypothetical protein
MRCSGLAQSRGAVPPISQRQLRRLTTFRGQQPCLCSSCPDHRLALGLPRAGWPGNYLSPMTLSFPKAKRLHVFPAPGSELSFRHMTRGFPQGQAVQVFPSPRWLRAFFSPHSSGFPLCQLAQSSPFAGGARLLLARRPEVALCRVAPGSPMARGLGIALCRMARGFPRAGWLGVSSSPVAPGFSRPEGPDLPFAGWLGVSPLPVARGFPFAGYRPGGRRISTPIGGTAQGVSGSNFKIL